MVIPKIGYWFSGLIVCLLVSCGIKTSTFKTHSTTSIHLITKSFTNIYLIEKDGHTIMIDAGYAKDSISIENSMTTLGIDPYTIDYIILTHGHSDHTGSAAYFKNKYECTIVAGQGDVDWIENGKQGHLCPTSFMARIMKMSVNPTFIPVHVDVPIGLGGSLALSHWNLTIESLPGHTPGSLIIHGENEVFVGDLIRGRPLNKDKATRHYFLCDLEDNDDDILYLLSKSGEKVWYLGHFGPLLREGIEGFLE